jgi:hypothetical protein
MWAGRSSGTALDGVWIRSPLPADTAGPLTPVAASGPQSDVHLDGTAQCDMTLRSGFMLRTDACRNVSLLVAGLATRERITS